MLHLVENLIDRFGVRKSTAILVTVAILAATLFDYVYYAVIREIEMYNGWFYSDLLIATAVGWPVISLLLSLFAKNKAQTVALNDALSQVKELKALLPMCAGCKRIRDDSDSWQHPDVYIRDHTNSRVSHGLCPECERTMDS